MWFLTDTVRRFPARRMLLGCLVAVFVVTVGAPGVGVAKVDLDSWLGGMEGDPEDSHDYSGGGSDYSETNDGSRGGLDSPISGRPSPYMWIPLVYFDGITVRLIVPIGGPGLNINRSIEYPIDMGGSQ